MPMSNSKLSRIATTDDLFDMMETADYAEVHYRHAAEFSHVVAAAAPRMRAMLKLMLGNPQLVVVGAKVLLSLVRKVEKEGMDVGYFFIDEEEVSFSGSDLIPVRTVVVQITPGQKLMHRMFREFA